MSGIVQALLMRSAPATNTDFAPGAGSITLTGAAPTLSLSTSSTWDPATLGSGVTLSNGNLTATATASTGGAYGTRGRSISGGGDWYFEVTMSSPDDQLLVGIVTASGQISGSSPGWPGLNSNGFGYYGNGGQKVNNSTFPAYGATFTTGDVIGVRLNTSTGDITFYKNGTSQGTAFNVTSFGTNAFYPAFGGGTSAAGARAGTINTGDSAFTALPSGASAWG